MKNKCCIDKVGLEDIINTANILKIIAEENRLKILCILKKGDRCVCNIWQDLNLSQNLTSHHLKVLKKIKLIKCHKKGLNIIYSIDKIAFKKINILLTNFLKNYEK